MIDIKEIRIGNLLTTENGKVIVQEIGLNGINYNYLIEMDEFSKKKLFPTLITEELLLKLGFKKEVEDITKDKRYRLRLNGFCIDINKWSNTLGRDYGIHIDNLCCDSVLRGDIQYLHQLQNYIYDATKQELDITNIL